jgi:molybdopterin-dependent oxidoreductase alpha subunit
MRIAPRHWASLAPFGIGHDKPRHYFEMARTVWRNRDNLGYAWRVLRHGVCDGCALGTRGLADDTIDGVHLCMVRLNLLRLNTAGALDVRRLADVSGLSGLDGEALRRLGRLPYPLLRRTGDAGFTRLGWSEALALAGGALRRVAEADPRRIGFYLTSRGLTNESYYTAAKVARFLGTHNVDTSARICHAASTAAMKGALGWGASTCSYRDWIGTDVLVFFGANPANNQPVATKYMYEAKLAGTRIVCVNPYREPGMERYWIPSIPESAVFGTRLTDEFYEVHHGGDIAFATGAAKAVLEMGLENRAFIESRTAGYQEWRAAVDATPWEVIERSSGLPRERIAEFGRLVGRAGNGVFVWSMGVTQHRRGTDGVRSILNLGLLRGFVGRERNGLVPIRGHSGVQGGAEMGAIPALLPGSQPMTPENCRTFEEAWGFPIPAAAGLNAVQIVAAAGAGDIDFLYASGGSFTETLPEPEAVAAALAAVPLRVHTDIVLSPEMLVPPEKDGGWVLLLPARTRYEQRGGGTETTTERRVLYSPEIPGHRVGEALSEWEIPLKLGQAAFPERAERLDVADGPALRAEMGRLMPLYRGIESLNREGDAMQWGGPRLGVDSFATPDGKAHFHPVAVEERAPAEGRFRVSTRRGKQFNSMVQEAVDPLNGAGRDAVLMARADAERLGLKDADRVRLRTPAGHFDGRVRIAPVKPGNLQLHWPEGNAVIRAGIEDPECGVPDYYTEATVERVV